MEMIQTGHTSTVPVQNQNSEVSVQTPTNLFTQMIEVYFQCSDQIKSTEKKAEIDQF